MKPETFVFTVRLPIPMQEELDALAQSMDRSRSWLITEAIENYMDVQKWHIERIKEGIAAADRGEFATEEEMNALWDKYNVPRT